MINVTEERFIASESLASVLDPDSLRSGGQENQELLFIAGDFEYTIESFEHSRNSLTVTFFASNNNLGQILSLDCDEAKVLCRGAVTRINITGYDLTRHILRLEDDKYRVVLDFKESKV